MKRRLLAFMLAALFSAEAITVNAQSADWGLGFGVEGAKPTGNASAEELKELDAYFIGEGDEKNIFLTFDAGYENGNTKPILDTLKKMKVPAAFFLVGTYIRDYPELVCRMADEGHIVGNHTMNHPDMSAISDLPSFTGEIDKAEEHYKTATGEDMPKYYRPPQGKYSENNLKMAHELGYKTVFWSLAYVDWNTDAQPTRDEAFGKLLPRLHPGAVLLLHSTSTTNVEILEELIQTYRDKGYTFKSLDDLTA
jgi:Predicted xylanase/chitin deacetylase